LAEVDVAFHMLIDNTVAVAVVVVAFVAAVVVVAFVAAVVVAFVVRMEIVDLLENFDAYLESH
jgi:hypothetical protein